MLENAKKLSSSSVVRRLNTVGSEDGLALFLALSFSLAWACWGLCWYLGNRGGSSATLIPIVIAGSFGPFAAAGVCAAREGGFRGMIAFYVRVLQWRMGWTVLLLSVVSLPILAAVTAAIFEGGAPLVRPGLADIPRMYLWLLVLGGPVGEEFGWSYLSDRLDRRMSLRLASLVLGIVWAMWHLPLFFVEVPGLSQRFVPFPAFLALSFATRGLFAWTYYRGGRSILSNLLMHNGLNVGLSIVAVVLPTIGSAQPRLWCFSMLIALAAIALWSFWPLRQAVDRGVKPGLKEDSGRTMVASGRS